MGSCVSTEGTCTRSRSDIRPKRKKSRKRFGSRSSSMDSRKDEQLHKIHGRKFFNGASENACLYTQQGKKGTNQDAMLVWENFGSRTDTVFCGVFDGHGPYGHMVSKRVRDSLPQKLSAQWELNVKNEEDLREASLNCSNVNSEEASFISVEDEPMPSVDGDETEKQTHIFQTLKESFLKAFRIMDRELRVHANVDCFCSGTTAVTFIKQGQDLVLGNVGDSRAVLGTRAKDNNLVAVQLTVDLKPNLPEEAERIRKCRGRVFALRDEPDVPRVWLPDNDSPGLAMARAFGDFCLKDYGLIAVPDISYRRLSDKDEFVILATDGIWDVLSNKEVVDVVASSLSRSTAARALVETAVRAWKLKYPTSKVDDCAVVCLFLDSNTNNMSSSAFNSVKVKDASQGEAYEGPTGLGRSGTVRSSKGNLPEEDANDLLIKDWSALESVSRVNTLVNLPRSTSRGKRDNKSFT